MSFALETKLCDLADDNDVRRLCAELCLAAKGSTSIPHDDQSTHMWFIWFFHECPPKSFTTRNFLQHSITTTRLERLIGSPVYEMCRAFAQGSQGGFELHESSNVLTFLKKKFGYISKLSK
jgi:hypothetical protein